MTDQPVPARYTPQHQPWQNEDFPWGVHDALERPGSFIGPCFNPSDAAVIAWALSNRVQLAASHPELRALIDARVARRLTEADEAQLLRPPTDGDDEDEDED